MSILTENSSFIQSRNPNCIMDVSDAIQIEGHPLVKINREKINSCAATKALWYSLASIAICIVCIIAMIIMLISGIEGWWIALLLSFACAGHAGFTYWWTTSPSNWNSDIAVYNKKVHEMTDSFKQNNQPVDYDWSTETGKKLYADNKKAFDDREARQASQKIDLARNTIMQQQASSSSTNTGLGAAGLGMLASSLWGRKRGGDDDSEVDSSEYVTGGMCDTKYGDDIIVGGTINDIYN